MVTLLNSPVFLRVAADVTVSDNKFRDTCQTLSEFRNVKVVVKFSPEICLHFVSIEQIEGAKQLCR